MVDHAGTGHPWVTLEARAAIPLKVRASGNWCMPIGRSPTAVCGPHCG
jgi:hypothetical protein